MQIASPDSKAVEDQPHDDLPPFFYLKDLVGRHVVIWPKEIATEDDPFNPGRKQEKITADVLVVDGRKTKPSDERNVFPKLPRFQRGVWLRGYNVITLLKSRLPDSGSQFAGWPVLAYVEMKEKAYWLADADADVAKAVEEGQYDEFVEADQAQADKPPF